MNDIEWARDLFDRSHSGAEPAWVADHVELARLGRRRSRARALAASGGGVAAVAAAAVAAVGITGGTASKPVPVAAKPVHVQPVDPYKIFQYFSVMGENQPAQQANPVQNPPRSTISLSAATTLATLVDRLDPTHAHLHNPYRPSADAAVVAVSDPIVTAYTDMSATSQWTADGKVTGTSGVATEPSGTLSLRFMNSGADLAYDTAACGADLAGGMDGALDPVPVGSQPQGWTDGAKPTPCVKSELGDGSMLMTISKSYKDYSILTVTRSFPGDSGIVTVTWSNFRTSVPKPGSGMPAPDPESVVTPEPFTEKQLADAMSGPAVVTALTPAPALTEPGNLLLPSDFGSGWTIESTHSTTGDLVVDNGCVNEQNPVAKVDPVVLFQGTTPSGQQVQATAEVDSMAAGKGPSWMSELRKYGTGGCDQGPSNSLKYSKDSMTALPSGIGDDAFIENWYGQGSHTFWIRFNEDFVRVDITKPDYSMPTFTPADQTWFVGLAQKAAARYSGAKG